MKTFFTSLLLLLAAQTSLGQIPPASVQPYYLDPSTYLYTSLGFGSAENLTNFVKAQISCGVVAIYQEDGTGWFNQVPYDWKKDQESFNDFVIRISNLEFHRVLQSSNYNPNQTFAIKYQFGSKMYDWGQFFPQVGLPARINFQPEQVGSVYNVPSAVADNFDFRLFTGAGGTQSIKWDRILEASVTVFDKSGNLIYLGNSKTNYPNLPGIWVAENGFLDISRSFLTNGYTGTLNIALQTGDNAVYNLEDGSLLYYPQSTKPLVGVEVGSKLTVTVNGGAPGREIMLQLYTNLSQPPKEEILTLDRVGSLKWTSEIQCPIGFFTVKYPYEDSASSIAGKR